jgi:hypothetical protein
MFHSNKHVFKKLHVSYTKNVHLLLLSDLKVITMASKIHQYQIWYAGPSGHAV